MSPPFADRRITPWSSPSRAEADSEPPFPDSLREHSPLRPASWRWQKATLLKAAGREPDRLRDDAFVATALDFQRALERCRDPWDELDLAERWPYLLEAYRVYRGTGNVECARWELEARLLVSDNSIEDTAAKMGCQAETVQWYERLFFNVRDRLHLAGWLAHHALGRKVHTAPSEADVELVWKLAALGGGVVALEDMMRIVTPSALDDPDFLPRYYREQSREQVARRATIAAWTLRARDPLVKVQLMELQARYAEMEAKLHGPVGGEDDRLLDGLQAVLGHVKLTVATATAARERPCSLPNGAELRAGPLFRAALGAAVDLPDGMAEAKFPESRRPRDEPAAGEDAPGDDTEAA
jgi:hypothetical protein